MNARAHALLMGLAVLIVMGIALLAGCGSSSDSPPQQQSPTKNDKDVRLIKVHVNGHTEMFCVVYRPSGSISCQWP